MIPQFSVIPSRQRPATFSSDMDAMLSEFPAVIQAMNSLEQSLQLVATTGTSESTLTIVNGPASLVTQTGKAWGTGIYLYLASAADPQNMMVARVTAYDPNTGALSVNVLVSVGAGTFAAWVLGLSALPSSAAAVTVEPTAAQDKTTVQAAIDALAAKLASQSRYNTGDFVPSFSPTAPPGTVPMDGGTIGNVGSGASRANADTAALFAMLWGTDMSILASNGAAAARGESAAADFAAGKRIVIRAPRDGDALLMAVTSAIGALTDGEIKRHTHGLHIDGVGDHTHGLPVNGNGQGHAGDKPVVAEVGGGQTGGAGAHTHSGSIDSTGGDKNKAAGLYLRPYIAL